MKRLAEETGDAFGLSLLQSARGDAPSAEARERTAVALGVTVATTAAAITTAITTATTTAATTASTTATATATTTTTATAAAAATTTATAAATTTGLTTAALAGSTLVVKATIALLVTGVLAAGTLAAPAVKSRVARAFPTPVAEAPGRAAVVRPVPPPAVVVPTLATAAPVAVPAAEAPVVVAPATQAPPVARPSVIPPAPAASPAPGSRDLTAAMSLLDAARTSLEAHDPARALSTLDAYDRQFPRGALSPEAAVLRIEALVADHADAAALAAADRFVAATPDSPHARHVRALVAPLRTNP